ncbi:MAG: nucleotidyltransferase domain-containing protein [Chloroflexota bacterium]|nr:nucleotidyltransferase domain-containing protein [Chloroflexota bacterium]
MTAVSVNPAVMRVARAAARDLMREGARAVVLTGSHARGEAHRESDIDLVVLLPRGAASNRRPAPIQRRASFLITIAWETEASVRCAFRDPKLVGSFVPGWRDAIALDDPEGVAARLQRAAMRWRWEDIESQLDAWVAEQIAGYAEEVQKLVAALDQRNAHAAAVQRSLLALHLAKIMSVHHRILYGSENVLWDLVAERMADAWARAQARALGEQGERFEDTCAAALELYRLAAAEAGRTLNRRQRAVVAHACVLEL